MEHEDFALAIEEARESRMQPFVQEAKKSLLRKIQGYEVAETSPTEYDPRQEGEALWEEPHSNAS